MCAQEAYLKAETRRVVAYALGVVARSEGNEGSKVVCRDTVAVGRECGLLYEL